MDKIDELVGRALTDEDRALLARDAEPGYVSQAFGLFRGPQRGVMWLVNITAGVAFLAGIFLFAKMMASTDALRAVQFGVGALFVFQITTLCKGFMGNRLESNRLLRELKRLELQLSLATRRGAG